LEKLGCKEEENFSGFCSEAEETLKIFGRLLKQCRIEDAIRLCKEFLEERKGCPIVSAELGQLLENLGRFDEAEKIYLEWLKTYDEDYEAHLAYARLLAKLERYGEARQAYIEALDRAKTLIEQKQLHPKTVENIAIELENLPKPVKKGQQTLDLYT